MMLEKKVILARTEVEGSGRLANEMIISKGSYLLLGSDELPSVLVSAQ